MKSVRSSYGPWSNMWTHQPTNNTHIDSFWSPIPSRYPYPKPMWWIRHEFSHGGCVYYGQGPLVLWRGAEEHCIPPETRKSSAILSQELLSCQFPPFFPSFERSWKIPGHELSHICSLVHFMQLCQVIKLSWCWDSMFSQELGEKAVYLRILEVHWKSCGSPMAHILFSVS